MTLEAFVENYGNSACISIDGYCSEKSYDYINVPTDYLGIPDEDALSDNNPNHYKPQCLEREPWWNEIKDKEIKRWNIGGGGTYKVELVIELEEE